MTHNTKQAIHKTRKLVVVGDGMAGKTCLLHAFKYNKFDSSQPPTIFETYSAEIKLDEKIVSKYYISSKTHFRYYFAIY